MGFEQILQTRSSFVRYTVRHRSGRHGVLCSRQCVPLLQRQHIDAAARAATDCFALPSHCPVKFH